MAFAGKINNRENIKYLILFLLILVLAVFIRVWRFGEVPAGMNQDGAMAAVDAKALSQYGTDRFGMRLPVHLTAWGFGQMSALLSYLMAPFIRLFGLTVTAARLPLLLTSLAGLLCLWLFTRQACGIADALIVLAFAAICPWHILQSRWALDCNLFPHFLMMGCCLLLYGAERGKAAFTLLSMVFFGLSMYCYGISIYTVPLLLLLCCICLLRRKLLSWSTAIFSAAVYILIAWPFITCMIINTFSLQSIETPLFTIPYFPYSMRSADILFFSDAPFVQLGANARSLLCILIQRYNGAVCNEVKGFGTLYAISLPFMAIGGIATVRQARKNTGCLLCSLWFVTALLCGLITANVNINRINIIFYPLIFFTGMGIRLTIKLLSRCGKWRAAIGVLPVIYAVLFLLFAKAYFTTYAEEVADAFMADFAEALTAVKDTDADTIYISPDAQYKGFAHVSEILTLFWHDTDAADYQDGSFQDKYRFAIPEVPDAEENAVYVASQADTERFPAALFDVEDHGKFFVAAPKGKIMIDESLQ